MAVREGATQSLDSVSFSFMTSEEVRKCSVLRITNPRLADNLNLPIPGGLYDPALGPLEENALCKTCGQRLNDCPGHFGHIDLVFPVYNPLLFHFLHKLLQRTCLNCFHFTTHSSEVENFSTQLELIVKGDIAGAKRLEEIRTEKALKEKSEEASHLEESDVSHASSSTIHSGSEYQGSENFGQKQWTSLQFAEVMSVIRNFLRLNSKKCKNCDGTNPKFTKPTFGLLRKSGLTDKGTRTNLIRGCSLGGPLGGEMQGMTDVEDSVEHPSSQEMRQASELLPSEVKGYLECLWENEARFCSFISDIQQQGFGKKKGGPSMFFLDTILVPPIKFRPQMKGGDSVMDHPQTVLLSKVLQSNVSLGDAYINKEYSKIAMRMMDLQRSINVLFDSKTAKGPGQGNLGSGICQLLEKKEGLFRQKMMGKRVNYACRSVISPDPYLGVNEIGIPPCFATKLTYPERVTPWNVAKLRNAVINGSEIHPGATYYVDKLSSNKLPPSRKMRISIARKLSSSRGAVSQLGKNSDYDYEGKIVHRHVRDGDVVLVNRQPTLHKPSIMAHVVRVLKGEKTLRMHYANCSTYNADFDGDEMNVHLPQDEVSRAEAYNIVNANNQYVRPSNGEPLRALIQDHIISSTLLTKRDTFLTLNEFNQLLYSSGVCNTRSTSFHAKPGQKVLFTCTGDMVDTLQPAILKPVKLWTGKQVITAVLNHITKGYRPFTVEKGGKLPGDFFKTRIKPGGEEKVTKTRDNKMEPGKKRVADEDKLKQDDLDKKEPEDKLLVYENELLRGMIDKAQFGEYGLVHTVQELYGSNTAGVLLSVFSRLFTAYLQMHGFTCGVDDLLIVESKDIERKAVLEACEKSGENVHCAFAGIKTEKDQAFDPFELQLNIEKTIRNDGDSALAYLDRQMTNDLNSRTSVKKITELLSEGLLKPSGKNCISLMTTSGAKGSKVNFQQISTFLGQQELEGKRVPRMVSGKTLPCFHPWDWAARAGGYISDRFLTGLRPQEYYFHCMAGREGLVDTAVKTSRSGYLQRCLIKNLEGLQIGYDHTVRDADGSIIQFLYGEDGVDVHRTSFITKFEALTKNQAMMQTKCDDQLGMLNAYISELPEALINKADKYLDDISLMERISSNLVKPEDLRVIAKQKFLSSLAQPGEPVGVLAAQSVGEPSTQMTLNTFHLAGRGEMNVTLGIPRLQEIFMTASRDIETPIMTCPFQERINNEEANVYAMKLRKVTVADIIESIEVSVQPFAVQHGDICRIYKLKIKLRELPTFISAEDCKETLEVVFLRALEDAIQNHMVLLSKISGIRLLSAESEPHSSTSNKGASSEVDEDVSGSKSHLEVNDDEDDDDDHDGGRVDASEDLGLEAHKRKLQATDEMDYEDGFGKEIDEGDSLTDENSEIDVEDNKTVNKNSEMDEEDNETVNENSEIDVEGNKTVNKNSEMDEEDNETLNENSEIEVEDNKTVNENKTKSESSEPKAKDKQRNPVEEKQRASKKLLEKDSDREIFSEASESHFEVHFKFTNEPHLLLAEIAQRTAEIVYIQNPGKIERYRVTDCSENQVIYYGKDPKRRVEVEPRVKKEVCALHTSGVNFNAFWQMQDILDVRCIYSNSVHAMLETYGVEAARETIIREVNHVFSSYGISVSVRHLSLIADYMTHTGGYRPMSRLGGIAESTSPFGKMSFETATKFIVDAALYGEIDNLDAPSARICLGLPVKMGTGSFDLMQKMEI